MEQEDHNQQIDASPERVFVHVPPAHQGVADALRAVYTPVNNGLPNDMQELLNRLCKA